jgi:N-acetylglutamate synthase-like GNAT family acetyltransferase
MEEKIQIYEKHDELIPFYSARGIEIADSFENAPFLSYVIKEDNELIAAVTCSEVSNVYIIEAIAVNEKQERRGVGTRLLKYVLKELQQRNQSQKIILNAKNTAFFQKNGFVVVTNSEDVPSKANDYCRNCDCYGITCFPKIMKLENY